MTNKPNNFLLIEEAKKSIAGGANSTMRVLSYQKPLMIRKAEGVRVWDTQGNVLIDLNMAYGPLIFGHHPNFLLEAIKSELDKRGTVLGFPHELSHKTAELIKKSFPSIDMLRFASTGSEVVQTAIRLAKAFTNKPYIIQFEGHYHGSSSEVFCKYHMDISELENKRKNHPIPGTNGMKGSLNYTILIPWNNIPILRDLLEERHKQIAAVIMEPVMGNSGIIPPAATYLRKVRELTRKYEVLLIFDEIITGYRIARGGAQERFNVQSDITTLSKAMSGGVPVSAVGGRKDILEQLSSGVVFHGGVYSGHPLGLAAAYAVQQEYEKNGNEIYMKLENKSNYLKKEIEDIFSSIGIPVIIQSVGAMLSLAFVKEQVEFPPKDYRELHRILLHKRYIHFQHALQDEGVFIHPNCFEPWYLSVAHKEEILEEIVSKIKKVAKLLNWNKI